MRRRNHIGWAGLLLSVSSLAVAALLLWANVSKASSIAMKDGRIISGRVGVTDKLLGNPLAQAGPVARPVLFLDDDLRRIFMPKFQVNNIQEVDHGEKLEKILIQQRVARVGAVIGHVGPIIAITPFDQFGRRTFSMMSEKGRLDIVQGITEITPVYTKVEGIAVAQPFVWDMRIATSSIPRETLSKILSNPALRKVKGDPKGLEARLSLVRLLLQSERYQDAQLELQTIIKDFPEEQRLQGEVSTLKQLHARRIIDEINLRRKAGQHAFAYDMLNKFPPKDVAGETLQQVREILAEYKTTADQGKQVLQQLKACLANIKNERLLAACKPIQEELERDLNINTLDRLADFIRLADDEKMNDEDKYALAISGWLLGSGEANTNLPVALSMYTVRDLVRAYVSEPLKLTRSALLKQIAAEEGSSPRQVARIIALMKPPVETPPPPEDKPGYYTLQIQGIDKEPEVTYYVQLPPEYDPYRRYPTVVTLTGTGTTAEQQLDWWSGAMDERGNRLGQATRQGYIVISVDWSRPDQKEYEFSAREHAAVLGSLRDACRRFAINTDKVFLSGHSMGGDAAWDIGLAHPDLWAGVIPIVAKAEKYCDLYWPNAKLLPFYVISGEMDGDKMNKNAMSLDRYLIKRFDTTVVEYLGRGHEHFYDEIQRIFDWMGRRERNFFPKEFEVATMRTWDNYFWWTEVREFPQKGAVDPVNWPPPKGFRPVEIKGKINGNNISVTSGANKVSVWLSPELVDFTKPVKISINGRKLNVKAQAQPELEVVLEDVRTRGERLHPFWMKCE